MTPEERRQYSRAWRKDRRERLKAEGLCTKCGRRIPVREGGLCEVCRAEQRERYRAKVESEGRTYNRHRTQDEYRKRHTQLNRGRRQKLIDAGLCVVCGKNPADKGYKSCEACRIKYRERQDDRKDIIYIQVTKDKYELPVAVADSVDELARMAGVNSGTIYSAIYATKRGRHRRCEYMRVEIDGDDDGNDE